MKRLLVWVGMLVALVALLVPQSVYTQTVKYLNDLAAATTIADTDTAFWCQVSTGCISTTPLVRASAPQIATYIFGKHSGDLTVTSAGVGTIANGAVTNAKQANMNGHTYKGNNTASPSQPIDVTNTQLTADLNLFTTALQGLTPASGGGTTNFLRADGTWAAPAGGGGVSVTAGTPSIVITPSPGTGTFTVGNTQPVDDRSGTGVPIPTADNSQLVKLGAFTYTLAQAGSAGFLAGWSTTVQNFGTSNATITTTTSLFTGLGNTPSSTLVLAPGAWAVLTSDGTNYLVDAARNYTAGTNVSLTQNPNGTTTIAATGGGGALSQIGTTQVASNSAAISFTSLGSYAYYKFICSALIPASASQAIVGEVSEDGGSTWKTSGYTATLMYVFNNIPAGDSAFSTLSNVAQAGLENDTAGASLPLAGSGNSTGGTQPGSDFDLRADNLSSTTAQKPFRWNSSNFNGTNYQSNDGHGWYVADTNAITAIRFRAASGNLTSGQCTAYGYSS